MAYWKDVYRFKCSNEYEFKYSGNYGAKGEKRAIKKQATPAQIKKQNQYNREKNMRRLIKANFEVGDLWTTLKYPAGTKKSVFEVIKDLKRFITNMRREYKKKNVPFKWIYRIEIGEKGGIHIHFLLNRLQGEATDVFIQKKWKYGRVFYTGLYEAGGYEQLASYIVKQPQEQEAEQLSLFPEAEQRELIRYSCSRNLIRPVAERQVYSRWTVRRLIENGPTATKGYFIDKNSIVYGINPYTGMSYYRYTEIKITRNSG